MRQSPGPDCRSFQIEKLSGQGQERAQSQPGRVQVATSPWQLCSRGGEWGGRGLVCRGKCAIATTLPPALSSLSLSLTCVENLQYSQRVPGQRWLRARQRERGRMINFKVWIIQYCLSKIPFMNGFLTIILNIKCLLGYFSCIRKSIILLQQNSHISPAWKLIQRDGEKRLGLVQSLICHSRELASSSQWRKMKNCCLEKEVTWIWMDDFKPLSRIKP